MNEMKECYDFTSEFIEWLCQSMNTDRNELIHQVKQFFVRRSEMLSRIKGPLSSDEQLLGKRLIILNEELNKVLSQIKTNIQRDINGLRKNRTSMQRYINPYASTQTDGFFYDKRK
jgi:flagellar protein FliT